MQTELWADPVGADPQMRTLPRQTSPLGRPRPPMDRQTPVKTIPFPKFRLRAVMTRCCVWIQELTHQCTEWKQIVLENLM